MPIFMCSQGILWGTKFLLQLPWKAVKMAYLKVFTASTQNKPVCFNELAFSSQCNINQNLLFQQTVKHCQESTMMIVPLQTELVINIHLYFGFHLTVLFRRRCL